MWHIASQKWKIKDTFLQIIVVPVLLDEGVWGEW
jgi:hypothetical protein